MCTHDGDHGKFVYGNLNLYVTSCDEIVFENLKTLEATMELSYSIELNC